MPEPKPQGERPSPLVRFLFCVFGVCITIYSTIVSAATWFRTERLDTKWTLLACIGAVGTWLWMLDPLGVFKDE